jgi:hypothetical protein
MTEQLTLNKAVSQIAAMHPIEAESAAGFGAFEGLPLSAEWDLDGRSCKLLAPVAYISEGDERWPVPAGAWLDGASIPRPFWSVIGGPFEGKYREPSVVHDHYCISKSRPWRDTHRMFHAAMMCRGVSSFKARIMFYAVYRFGPRWPDIAEGVGAAAPDIADDSVASSVLEDAQYLESHPLSPVEIERFVDARL